VASFGIEAHAFWDPALWAQLEELGTQWVRMNGVLWDRVEPEDVSPDDYGWQALATLEERWASLAVRGVTPIVVVRRAPTWALADPAKACGAVDPASWADLAEFMAALAARYSVPPYNVHVWELWNEPDVDPGLVRTDAPFGCWGNADDPYYGGQQFAGMLQVVVPAIRAADPDALVLPGSLLLDAPYDPANPQTVAGRFFEGVLSGGGGPYIDLIGFHGYVYYTPDGTIDDRQQAWPGGVIAGKVSFLRALLAEYGLSRPLLNTEAGILCAEEWGCDPDGRFLDAQAAYLVRTMAQGSVLALETTIWYLLDGPGWRNTGLLNADQVPRPAYRAFQHLAGRLSGWHPLTEVSDRPGLSGYAFSRDCRRLEVLWSTGGQPQALQLPAARLAGAWDLDGQPLSPQTSEGTAVLAVGERPIYIELEPEG
jgi:hypothetical protein